METPSQNEAYAALAVEIGNFVQDSHHRSTYYRRVYRDYDDRGVVSFGWDRDKGVS